MSIDKIQLKGIDNSTWKTFRFDQIAFNINERVEPSQTDLEIYVGLEHLDPETIHIKRFGKREDVKGTKLRVYPGDIIFGRRRAYQRKAAIANFDGFCSAHALVLRANPDVIDPKLFPFFMHSDTFMHLAVDISVGSLSPTINWGTLKKQEFLLPPKKQQARLVELLWAADEVTERTISLKYKMVIYSDTRSNMLLRMGKYKDIGINKWEEKDILDVAPLQRGFDLPDKELIPGSFPVCYSNGIKNYHNDYKVNGPGVFTGRSGTIGNVFYTEEDYWPHNTTLWVTDFKGNYPKYIYHLYLKLNFKQRMAGTGVPTLNRNDIHKLVVKVPKYEDQLNIADKLDDFVKMINTITTSINTTKTLKKSLINQIFE